MKVGIVGWYGHDNYGDDRILFCLRQQLTGHNLFICGGWEDARNNLATLNECDYVIIGGGGLLHRGSLLYSDFIQQLLTPFSFVGVSVESSHKDIYPFLDIVKERADRIIVRDQDSGNVFGLHPKVEVCTDLTFLCPLDINHPVEADVCGLNLRPWFLWKAELHGGFHKYMLGRSSNFMKLYEKIVSKKWVPSDLICAINSSFDRLEPLPFYFEESEENDLSLMSCFFQDVPTSFDSSIYQKFRLLIGMRFHALVFAVQVGVPFISLSYQPKNISFCKTLEMEELSVDLYDWEKTIFEKIDYVKENYNYIRQSILEQRSLLVDIAHKTYGDFFSIFKK